MENNHNEIAIRALDDLSIANNFLERHVVPASYKSIPVGVIASLGSGFESLVSAMTKVVNGVGGSGLYYVDAHGGQLFQKAGKTTEFIGNIKAANGGVGGGIADLTPAFQVGDICTAIALASIQMQLSQIKERQESIYKYLLIKDEAQLAGSVQYLMNSLEAYKMNIENEEFIDTRRKTISKINQETLGHIGQYKQLLEQRVTKKGIHFGNAVKKELDEILRLLQDYQMAVNLYSFTEFLDIVMHEANSEEYLKTVINKISNFESEYNEVNAKCCDRLEEFATKTIGKMVVNGLADAENAVGKAVYKIKGVKAAKVGQGIQEGSRKLKSVSREYIREIEDNLKALRFQGENVFIKQIENINMMYNHPVILMFDKDTLYWGESPEKIA